MLSSSQSPPTGCLFPTTRWSVVLATRDVRDGVAGEALESLCSRYWPPLYAFARRRSPSPHDAEDLTQEFFLRFLKSDWLSAAARDKGRLRSFLLTAMKRFLAKEWRCGQAAKRGGGCQPVSIAAMETEAADPVRVALPDEAAFDRAWAITILESTLCRLRAEYAHAGRLAIYERVKPCLTAPHGGIDYPAIAADLGLLPASARSVVARLRRRFGEIFRDEVAATTSDPADVDDELAALLAALCHL